MTTALRSYDSVPDHRPQETAPPEPLATARPHWTRRPLRVVPAIVAVNVCVFLAWLLAARGSSLEQLLAENFLVSVVHLVHGRVWTLLTSVFSHNLTWHIAVNMIVLYSFGSVLERLWGWRVFAGFYLVAGVVASASHCFTSALIGQPTSAALGASGAVAGLLLAYAFLFPKHRILVFGIVPVPALAGALIFVALDIWGLMAQSQGGGLPIGHGAHLGGAACGLLFYLAYLRPRLRRAGPPGDGPPAIPVTPEEAAELDRLRFKVEHEGPGSLTPKEHDFLRRLQERVASRMQPPT